MLVLLLSQAYGLAAVLPLSDGVYVSADKSCEDAGSANTVIKYGNSISYAHLGCEIKNVENIGPSAYEITEECSYMSDPDRGTEIKSSKITITGRNEFLEADNELIRRYVFCDALTAEENAARNDGIGRVHKSPPEERNSHGASFDCRKAVAHVEKTICSDYQLSNLDSLLANTYKKALANAVDPGELKAEQHAWLTTRDKCLDAACLAQAYNARLTKLGAIKPRIQKGQNPDQDGFNRHNKNEAVVK
jgi:uncharacterized protein YecT (DUF1311 family)